MPSGPIGRMGPHSVASNLGPVRGTRQSWVCLGPAVSPVPWHPRDKPLVLHQPRACLCPVWGLSGAPVCGHCGAPRTLLGQVWVLHRAHSVAIAHRCASATLETSLKGWWGLRWGQSIWGLWSVWGQPGGQPYMANLSEPSLGWGPTLRRAGPVSTDGDTYNYRRDHSWRWRWGCDGG